MSLRKHEEHSAKMIYIHQLHVVDVSRSQFSSVPDRTMNYFNSLVSSDFFYMTHKGPKNQGIKASAQVTSCSATF